MAKGKRLVGETGITQDRPRPAGMTPLRRVVRETSDASGLRELHLECGHSCVTRDHAVVEQTSCLLCAEGER